MTTILTIFLACIGGLYGQWVATKQIKGQLRTWEAAMLFILWVVAVIGVWVIAYSTDLLK